ncbi:unnamed protein product [Amoebophrya sp. A120]|nr:unnamed protein product [Amoebophrya sp. A120]|eukprot:GSA120T00012216001.1
MVVLSAAILSKKKTLLARQFVDMTRLRVDGLLSAFPKLVDSEKGKDHTYIETESVRYVYQPMEKLFLLLITNKTSNILEDIETLRLLAKTVQDGCKNVAVSEESVLQNAFDIIFAFDEVISFGYRESVTLSQIKQYLEMESNDEKLAQRIEQSKINEAKELAKKKALELSPDRKGFGSANMPKPVENEIHTQLEQMKPPVQEVETNFAAAAAAATPGATNAIQASLPKRGMQLGRKKPAPAADAFSTAMATNEVPAQVAGNMPVAPAGGAAAAMAPVEPPRAPVNPLQEPVSILVEETVEAALGAEGGLLGDLTLQGKFEITVHDDAKADLASFKLKQLSPKFKYRLHPNLNKAAQGNNLLEIRDPTKKYRPNAAAALLKWQYKAEEEDLVPLSVTCWPSPEADGVQMIIQYELTDDNAKLENIVMRIPTSGGVPQIKSVETGEASMVGAEWLQWAIPSIDASSNAGTLEFFARVDAANMLPVQVRAYASKSVCPMDIESVYHQSSQEVLKYAMTQRCEYQLTIG